MYNYEAVFENVYNVDRGDRGGGGGWDVFETEPTMRYAGARVKMCNDKYLYFSVLMEIHVGRVAGQSRINDLY